MSPVTGVPSFLNSRTTESFPFWYRTAKPFAVTPTPCHMLPATGLSLTRVSPLTSVPSGLTMRNVMFWPGRAPPKRSTRSVFWRLSLTMTMLPLER